MSTDIVTLIRTVLHVGADHPASLALFLPVLLAIAVFAAAVIFVSDRLAERGNRPRSARSRAERGAIERPVGGADSSDERP